jgi:hypothetical protein
MISLIYNSLPENKSRDNMNRCNEAQTTIIPCYTEMLQKTKPSWKHIISKDEKFSDRCQGWRISNSRPS